jgi:hypothetical protein
VRRVNNSIDIGPGSVGDCFYIMTLFNTSRMCPGSGSVANLFFSKFFCMNVEPMILWLGMLGNKAMLLVKASPEKRR